MYKLTPVKILRRLTQLVALIFFTGTFALAFSGFATLVTSLVNRQFNWSALGVFLAPLGIVIALSLLLGRIFCSWFCAFGAFNDLLYSINKRLFKIKIRFAPQLDGYLKYLKYGVLIFLAIFTWCLNLLSVENISPWTPFAQLGEVFKGRLPLSLGLVSLGLVTLGAFLIERFFCRYLCPLGAILAPLSKVTLTGIAKPTAECRSCKLCSKSCPMGIDLSAMETVKSPECIRCLECITVCPRRNPKLNSFSIKMNIFIYAGLAILIFGAISFSEPILSSWTQPNAKTAASTAERSGLAASAVKTGGATNEPVADLDQPVSDPQPDQPGVTAAGSLGKSEPATLQSAIQPAKAIANPSLSKGTNLSKQRYKDGTYSGTATGFRPGLNVEVTLKKDRIINIEIRENQEDRPFLERVSQSVTANIIATQSTDVDTVSGATYSSRGVINAVKDALSKAK